jgi:hypothetical protein
MDLKYPMLSAPDVLIHPAPEVVSPVARRSVLRAVFSFPVMLATLLVLLMVLTVRERFNDPDMWWHLKTGELIWKTHSIPRVDPFSFTAFGKPWIAQEWLSEATMYGAYHLGGYTGLMLWLCTFSGLFAVLAYLLCCLYSGNSKVALVGGIVAWLFSTIGLSIRPHLLGYILLVCELLILHLGRTRNPRWLVALPPVFALWINLHSSFFFGLFVLGVVFLCSFLDFELGLLVSRPWGRKEQRALLFATGLSFAALLLNPIGPKLVWYPVDVMLNQPLNLHSVSEWQPTSLDGMRGIGLLLVAGLALLIPLFRRRTLTLQELILVVVGFWFASRHERMLFIFGILAAPTLCRLLADTWEKYDPKRDLPWPNAVMMAIGVAVLLFAFPGRANLEKQVRDSNPVKALEFIKRAGLSGPMLNEYAYGGYLIWASPERKVFIDGRADLYEPAGVLVEYGNWSNLSADPQALLDKYRVRFCVLGHDTPMTRVLGLLPGWKSVHSDKISSVFTREK